MKKIFNSKEEAINGLNEFIDKFKPITQSEVDDLFDDGYDSGDQEQNARYCKIAAKIDTLHKEIANYKFSFIPESVSNRIWREAWGANPIYLPENKWSHAVDYAKKMIEYLKSDKKELYIIHITSKDFAENIRIEDIQGALTGEADKLWPYNRGKDVDEVYPAFSRPYHNDYLNYDICGVAPVKDHSFALIKWAHEDCGHQFYEVCRCYNEKPASLEDAIKDWCENWRSDSDGNIQTYQHLLVEYSYE